MCTSLSFKNSTILEIPDSGIMFHLLKNNTIVCKEKDFKIIRRYIENIENGFTLSNTW